MVAAAEVARQDEDRGKLYVDAVLSLVSEAAREILEAVMRTHGYEYQSDFVRKYVQEGREEGLL